MFGIRDIRHGDAAEDPACPILFNCVAAHALITHRADLLILLKEGKIE